MNVAPIWKNFLSNKWLWLMGAASLALSLASGWTTYDGMTNLIRVPLICLLVTFGVQGLMLAASWLIGEQLAVSKSLRQFQKEEEQERLDPLSQGEKKGLHYWVMLPFQLVRRFASWMKRMWYWPVFLFSMLISVFFSYDSLFSTIFPQGERLRAAQIRSGDRVQELMGEMGTKIEDARLKAVDHLLTSKAWERYNLTLDQLGKVAASAPEAVEQHMLAIMKKRQEQLLHHAQTVSEQKTQAQATGLRAKEVEAQLTKLRTARAAVLSQVQSLHDGLKSAQGVVDNKEAEILAELRGIGNTGKTGKGPRYRALKVEEAKAIAYRDVAQKKLEKSQTHLHSHDGDIAKLTHELAALNADIAKANGAANIAEKFVENEKSKQASLTDVGAAQVSLQGFEDTRTTFQKLPTGAHFKNIVQTCVGLQHGLQAVPQVASKVTGLSCEPGALKETIAPLLALEAGAKQVKGHCGASHFAPKGSLDELLAKAQDCVGLSGLKRTDAAQFRASLKRLELNRDDKAHNFVVTLNALSDGNWLAYLALAIALAIDSLVFLSGLVGASARSVSNLRTPQDYMDLCLSIDTASHPADSDSVRNAKNVLRSCIGPSQHKAYVTKVDMELVGARERSAVRNALVGLGARNDVDPEYPEHYYLSRKSFGHLARVLEAHKAARDSIKTPHAAQKRNVETFAPPPAIGSWFGQQAKGEDKGAVLTPQDAANIARPLVKKAANDSFSLD